MAVLAPKPLLDWRNWCFGDVLSKHRTCGIGEEDEVEVCHQHDQHRKKGEPEANTPYAAVAHCCDPVKQSVVQRNTICLFVCPKKTIG